jgi:hypothetical protein
MTFTPLMQQVVSGLDFTTVCEFGNQRYTGTGGFASTKEFYESLGCTDYVALDVNEDKDAIIADLNEPVYWVVKRQFDLVTNNGTGEHIFNQHSVFRNAHVLSSKFMVHCLPMLPWVNHGFYNYTPVLFRDLAYANSYRSTVFVANRWGESVMLSDDELFKEKRPKVLEESVQQLAVRGGVFVVAIFEKTNDSTLFQTPFQGKYQSDIQDEGLRSKYS